MQVIAGAGAPQIDRRRHIDQEALSQRPLLGIDAVIGVELHAFEEDFVNRRLHAHTIPVRRGRVSTACVTAAWEMVELARGTRLRGDTAARLDGGREF